MLFLRSPLAHGPDPLLVLLGALLLDALLGDMPFVFRRLPHPVALLGLAIAWFERRLNRPQRGERARRVRGIVTVLLLVGGAALLGWLLQLLFSSFARGWAAEMLVIAILVAQRSLFDRVRDVSVALSEKGLAAGRQAVSHIVGRDPQSLDEHGVARAGIESLAENLSDGVVAPVFWTLLLGLPGLFAYKAANTLDSMIGHRSPRYLSFGWAAARLDDLLNLVPARLTGLLIAIAALLAPRAAGGGAMRIMLRDAGKHRSPNAGWPEAAMAGSLGLALVGPRRYEGHLLADPWLGDGRARATPSDMNRALVIYTFACVLQAAAIILLFLLLPVPHVVVPSGPTVGI